MGPCVLPSPRGARLWGRGLAGCVACPDPRPGSRPRAWRGGRGLARCVACPGPRPGSRWPAGARPARGTRTSAARLRTGGEEESPRTGDSNPGCNCLVRGYSPSMHFFWGGDMPRYSPPLPFRRGRVGCPCVLPSPRGRPARGSWNRSSGNVQKGQNFGLALNIGPAFSDRFQVLTAI